MYHFGSWTFDSTSGELTRDDATHRLTPQSAHVLQLMLERSGEVVTREELRRRVWPDTTVEFDQGLNFCIRQLRIALGDDASSPTYIETLPRRGYRFLQPVRRADTSAAPAPPERTWILSSSRWRWAGLGAIGLGLVLLLYARAHRHSPIRLAVVPFDVVPATQDLVEYRDGVAESIVERVTNSTPGSVSVMGPSTTRAFGALTMIDTIRGRTGAAYALSGRVRRRGESFEIFAQLIRADDRGHIWVAKWLDSTPTGASSASIGQRIGDSVSTILLHADSPRRPALPDHRPKGAN